MAVICLVLASVFAAGIRLGPTPTPVSALSEVCQSHKCACSLAGRCDIQCCCQGEKQTQHDHDEDDDRPFFQNRDCVPFQGFGVGVFRLLSVVFPGLPQAPLFEPCANPPRPRRDRGYWIAPDPPDKVPIFSLFSHE
ncbi:hypothetical protein [Acanthopleuribacter pedis]|uniref:Uncharacterized protein n=1 Tax=Acanthopleuribacter pedis TaxID=442870 RepID=A0A8J7U5M8_9BACT|nr:hypothetical protein [Acanthopleuribacter pedis]MBO1322728.1 hypothetical protein [Acanthopleuribacter pedis]